MTVNETIFNHSNAMMDDAVTKAINAQVEPVRTFTNEQLIDLMMENVHKIHKHEEMIYQSKMHYRAGYIEAQLTSLMNMFPEVLAEMVDRIDWQNQIIASKGL